MRAVFFCDSKFDRYEEQSIFDLDKFIKVSEEYFNNTVVKFRSQYDIMYFNDYQEFTDKNTGLKIRRYYS